MDKYWAPLWNHYFLILYPAGQTGLTAVTILLGLCSLVQVIVCLAGGKGAAKVILNTSPE
jgi:hypothetical protein